MLRDATIITRQATITVIEHHLLSKYKIFSRLSHQFKESNQFATPALRVAPTQSRHRAKRITRDAKNVLVIKKIKINKELFNTNNIEIIVTIS